MKKSLFIISSISLLALTSCSINNTKTTTSDTTTFSIDTTTTSNTSTTNTTSVILDSTTSDITTKHEYKYKVNTINLYNDGKSSYIEFDDYKELNIPSIDGYILNGIYTNSLYDEVYDFNNFNTSDTLCFKWNKTNTYYTLDEKINLDNYISNMIENTTSYYPSWNREGFKDRWNYIDGVFLNSIISLYNENCSEEYIEFVKNYTDYYMDSEGNFIRPKRSSDEGSLVYDSAFLTTELDSICESRILFDLYDKYKDDKYLNAINYTYNSLINMPLCKNNLNYSHKVAYDSQIWLDGMYMYAPFLVRYATINNDTSIFEKLYLQYKYIYDNMRQDDGLYFHGFDTSKSIFWADSETGLSKSIWLRSLGWLMVSLTDVIEYYPNGDNKAFLINMLSDLIDSIYKYQDNNTKMYYQLPDKMNNVYYVSDFYTTPLSSSEYKNKSLYISNYLESSGSSMISYSMLKSARLGYIDSRYYDIGKMTFEGIYEASFNKDTNELNDICISAGLGDATKLYRDGSTSYYLAEKVGSNDAKGVGPFIMAYIEYKK